MLSHLSESGSLVALLCMIVWYLHKRDQRSERRAEERHRACEEDNKALGHRVGALEDRQFSELKAITQDALTGLAQSTQALMRFCIENELTPPPQSIKREHQP